MAALPVIDPSRCPLCGQANRCAIEIERETGVAQPACWCMSATFPTVLREAVPEASRNLACICATCAAEAAALHAASTQENNA